MSRGAARTTDSRTKDAAGGAREGCGGATDGRARPPRHQVLDILLTDRAAGDPERFVSFRLMELPARPGRTDVAGMYVRLGLGGYRSVEDFAADGAALVAGARKIFRADPVALADVDQWEAVFQGRVAALLREQEEGALRAGAHLAG